MELFKLIIKVALSLKGQCRRLQKMQLYVVLVVQKGKGIFPVRIITIIVMAVQYNWVAQLKC